MRFAVRVSALEPLAMPSFSFQSHFVSGWGMFANSAATPKALYPTLLFAEFFRPVSPDARSASTDARRFEVAFCDVGASAKHALHVVWSVR